MVERDRLIAPAYGYRVLGVRSRCGEEIALEQCSLRIPALAAVDADLRLLALAACTLGPALEARVSELFAARRPRLAIALDRLGTDALFRTADRCYERIRRDARRAGMQAGAEVNPGDPGAPIAMQTIISQLAETPGIHASPRGVLNPAMSLSMIVPIGHGLPSRQAGGRCDRCPSREQCRDRLH